jgi:hypothetical protein
VDDGTSIRTSQYKTGKMLKSMQQFEEYPVVLADSACSKLSLTNELLRKFA